MKKKLLGITAFAAVLTFSAGITAFAGTWKEDSWGRYYENDDGTRPVYGGWFTDPADGAMYAMDPDGYVMRNAEMGEFRTDDMGRRVEKTEAELRQEAERREYLATRPNPGKSHAAASVAAEAAKNGTAATATGTVRTTFQAEMEEFSFRILKDIRDKRTDTTVLPSEDEDNTFHTYGFKNPDGYQFLSSTVWKNTKETSLNYKPYSYELSYHFDSAMADINLYNDAYNQMAVIALGSNAGPAALEAIQTERNNGSTSFDQSGTTDTGNTYNVKYRNGLVTITVTCSGVDPTAAAQEAAQAESAETSQEAAPAEEAAPVSPTLVAGQKAAEDAE